MRIIPRYYWRLFQNEFTQLRSEISIPEYILWWLLRIGMCWGVCRLFNDPTQPFIFCLTVAGNYLMTFAVVLFRVIIPKWFFLGRLPYATQRYLNISVLFGSLFGHIFPLYGKIQNYDKVLHVVGGLVMVFLGYEIMRCLKHDNRPVSPLIGSFAGFGFSCFLIVFWELFEFFADYFIVGANNQSFTETAFGENDIFLKILGFGAQNAGQAAIYDTMLDMITALVAAVFGGFLLRLYIRFLNKRRADKPLTIDEQRWERSGRSIGRSMIS